MQRITLPRGDAVLPVQRIALFEIRRKVLFQTAEPALEQQVEQAEMDPILILQSFFFLGNEHLERIVQLRVGLKLKPDPVLPYLGTEHGFGSSPPAYPYTYPPSDPRVVSRVRYTERTMTEERGYV